MKPAKHTKEKESEDIVRRVVQRIKIEAPHADPIIVTALLSRIRTTLKTYRKARDDGDIRSD